MDHSVRMPKRILIIKPSLLLAKKCYRMIAECFEDNGTKPKTLINDGENMIIANEAIYYQITWVGKSNQNLSTFVRFDNKFDEVLTASIVTGKHSAIMR